MTDITTYLQFHECISDLIYTPDVQAMEQVDHHVNVTCLDHCVYVAYISFRMCRLFHLDFRAAARGGLLHDLFLYDWHEKYSHEGLHGFTHPAAALVNANNLCNLSKKEQDCISKHMWPLTLRKIPRYRESFVVSGVDKLCALSEMLHIYDMLRMNAKMELALTMPS